MRERPEPGKTVSVEYGKAIIVDDLPSLELEAPGEAAAAIYDRAIGLRLLHEDLHSGEEHYLVRYPAGTKGGLHRHTAAHTIVVLEGRLHANDRLIGPQAYAHFPGGELMRHEPADGQACLFVLIFHGPFDVRSSGDY